MNDEKRFCRKCSLNDSDYGCACPPCEEVYQCDMYRHYHPDEVAEFEEWVKQSLKRTETERAEVRETKENGDDLFF